MTAARIRRTAAFAIVAYVLVAAACGASETRSGQALYETRCSSCHGVRFGGSSIAPPLTGVGAAAVDFWLSTGRMPAMVPQNVQAMHATPQFSPAQIDAIVRYVTTASPGGPPIPHLDAVAGVTRGRALYAENCQACHGAMGQGGDVGYGYIAPSLYRASAIQTAEAIRTGPGPMPRFGPAALSQRDLDALAGYVAFLQTEQHDPGGFNLGNVGPVAEGLVAWVFGLGTLLGVIRWIGSTS